MGLARVRACEGYSAPVIATRLVANLFLVTDVLTVKQKFRVGSAAVLVIVSVDSAA